MQGTENRKLNMQKLLAPAALVILYVFFSIFGKNFFGYEGFKQILQSSYYIGFMAFGVTYVIITGGIDLSIGTVMMCSAIIGGTAMSGGSGSVVGTFLGVLLISLLKTGLPFINLQANWQQVITGCVLLAAVTIDMQRNRKRA